jgi:CPA2 family monovalent cation:H+ antiporter-2
LGQKIVKKLLSKDIPYMAIEHDMTNVKKGLDVEHSVFFGNASSKLILNSLYVKNAKAVIVAIDNDEKVRLIVEAIKAIDKNIKIVIKISHKAQIDDLHPLGVKCFIDENKIVAHELIQKAI